MPLDGAKDEHFSCFLSSCQLGLSQSIRCYKRLKSWAGLLLFQEDIAYGIFLFPVKKNGYPGILTQSMAMKSAPIIPPRIRGFTTATFSLVTSIIGTDLNLALPFMSIAFSKARFYIYKSFPYTK